MSNYQQKRLCIMCATDAEYDGGLFTDTLDYETSQYSRDGGVVDAEKLRQHSSRAPVLKKRRYEYIRRAIRGGLRAEPSKRPVVAPASRHAPPGNYLSHDDTEGFDWDFVADGSDSGDDNDNDNDNDIGDDAEPNNSNDDDDTNDDRVVPDSITTTIREPDERDAAVGLTLNDDNDNDALSDLDNPDDVVDHAENDENIEEFHERCGLGTCQVCRDACNIHSQVCSRCAKGFISWPADFPTERDALSLRLGGE